MKKLTAFCLAVLLCVSMITLPTSASDNTPTIQVADVSGSPGETVSVDLNIRNNPGIIAMRLYVSYDPAKLQLLDAEDTGLLGLGGALFGKDKTVIPYTLLWEDALAETNYSEDGTVATLTFEILETADLGDAEVSVTIDEGSTFNIDMQNVSFQTDNGTVLIQDPVPEKEILMIAVNEYPFKREYTVGDSLETTGLTLLVLYSDGSVETVTEGFSCVPTAFTTPGEQAVSVSYMEKETTFTVTVNPLEVVLIAVESYPYKTSYIVGDTLDSTGLTVTVLYSNGSTKTITDGFACSPMFFGESGEQDVEISYDGKTVSFPVTVEPLTVQYLAVSEFPEKREYFVGEAVDPEGLALVAIMNNGSIETITSGYTCSPDQFTEAGTQLVTVTYDGQSTTFEVTVNAPEMRLISVNTLPDKTVYYIDDEFVADGLTLTAVYSDGSTQTISEGFEIEAEPFSEIGKKTVTVSYNGFTTTLQVDVRGFPGDADEDGKVTLQDVVVITRWLAGGWNVTINDTNSDVNGDGEINLKDAVLIRRFLAGGWNVVLK